MKAVELARIRAGTEWVYTADLPAGCKGHCYWVHAIIPDVSDACVQSRCRLKVLVEALTGPDAGLLFCTSLWNFARRYLPYPEPEVPQVGPVGRVEEKVFGHVTQGSGV